MDWAGPGHNVENTDRASALRDKGCDSTAHIRRHNPYCRVYAASKRGITGIGKSRSSPRSSPSRAFQVVEVGIFGGGRWIARCADQIGGELPCCIHQMLPEKVRPQSRSLRLLPSLKRSPDPATAGFYLCFQGLWAQSFPPVVPSCDPKASANPGAPQTGQKELPRFPFPISPSSVATHLILSGHR
jgi:hypothetical protein